MQKVMTFCSGKGGVGKSTLAACISAAIVCRGKRVLLIDADQVIGNLSTIIGNPQPPLFDIFDSLQGRCDFYQTIVPCEILPGLNLAVVNSQKSGFCDAIRLSGYIRLVKSQFDYIIIDAPAGIGREFDAVLGGCEAGILVTTPDEVSLAAASKVSLQFLKSEKPARMIVNRYVPSMAKKRLSACIDQAIDTVGEQLLGVVPEDPEFKKLACSGALRLPVGAQSVIAFHHIAARICGETVALMKL